MGFPPPPDLPAPSHSVEFAPSPPAISVCGFNLSLPKFGVAFALFIPTFQLPAIPLPFLNFQLSCDPTKPISVSAGVAYGGGRAPNQPPSADLDEDQP